MNENIGRYVLIVFCFKNCSDLLLRKQCSNDREKLSKFKAKDCEFAKKLRSLNPFIQAVKDQCSF